VVPTITIFEPLHISVVYLLISKGLISCKLSWLVKKHGKGSSPQTCFSHIGISNVLRENTTISLQHYKNLGVQLSIISTCTNAASEVDLSGGHDLVDLRMRNKGRVKG
jgi:hypothetical protein